MVYIRLFSYCIFDSMNAHSDMALEGGLANAMGRTVLVTGACGFLGAHLCQRLVDTGDHVVALTRRERVSSPLHVLGLSKRVTIAQGDVRQLSLLRRLVDEHEVTAIVHLAGQPLPQGSLSNPISSFEANIASAWSVLEAARGSTAMHSIVMLSSAHVYSQPAQSMVATCIGENDVGTNLGPYAAGKRCAEVLAESYRVSFDIPVVVLRLANVYGPADPHRTRLIPNAIDSIIDGLPVTVHGDGSQVLDLLHVDDAVDGIMSVISYGSELQDTVYNLGSGYHTTVHDVVAAFRSATAGPVAVEYGSIEAAPAIVLDVGKLTRAVGFRPKRTLVDGIAATLAAERILRAEASHWR
ncbi:MAG: NAD(P)-dependent oxidoreductase [Myxococcota bacterium]|nr:NAD(P)-dependent oxidoreductase [Myxococcota bacterium]